MKISYVRTQPRFDKSFKKLDHESQTIIKKAIALMFIDLTHPSLRFKKMQGYRNPNVWEVSANMDLRITFEIEKPDTAILRNCGHHDATLNNP